MKGESVLQLIVNEEQTLKTFTENNYAQASFFWNTLLKDREIKVNGKRVSADRPLFKGDAVAYYLTPKQAEKSAFYRVYEDENVLVIDKESGVNAEAVFAQLKREGEYYFIHRLDRNTQGLMIFAKNVEAESALLQAFKEKRVEKRYRARCFGSFEKEGEVLIAYLKKDGEKSLARVYDKPVVGGEKIVTEYKVMQRLQEETVVEVVLHTGKTHQIRAHLAHIGRPIVGDMKYGNSAKNKKKKLARQCLVAKFLRITAGGVLAYLEEQEWISRFDV